MSTFPDENEADLVDQECECRKGMVPDPARRKLLLGGVALGAGIASSVASRVDADVPPPGAMWHAVPDDPTRQPGIVAGYNSGYGLRSQFETEKRWTFQGPVTGSFTPLQNLTGTITPSGLHYEVHHGGIPIVDPARHRLLIHGLVDRPKVFSMEDLKRFPSVTRTAFLECAGNTFLEWKQPTMPNVQGTHGLTSNSQWTGVALSTVLGELGIKDDAAWILAEGSDAGMMTRSVPIDKALDDALLVYAQNGEAIRPEQGYPLRLLLPGFEGNMSIKWLRRLEIGDKPWYTRMEVTEYTDPMPDGKSRIFSFEMEAKSVITFPSAGMKLPVPGFYEIAGLAWSGRGKISQVEVSINGGTSWAHARLEEPVLSKAHTRFVFPFRWDGRQTVIQSRAQDETGYVQPSLDELVAVRGTDSVNHNNAIQSWNVNKDGTVTNVHA